MAGARKRRIANRMAEAQRGGATAAGVAERPSALSRIRPKLIAAIGSAIVIALVVTYYWRLPNFDLESFSLSAPVGPDQPILYKGEAKNSGATMAHRVLQAAYIQGGPSSLPVTPPGFDASEIESRAANSPISDVPAGQTISVTAGRPYHILKREQYIAVMAGRHTLRIYTYLLYRDWLGISHSTRLCQAYLPKGRSGVGEFVTCPE